MAHGGDDDRDVTELAGAYVDDPGAQERSRANVRQGLFGGPSTAQRIGRYVVLGTLGAGGMGVVYRAWDPQLARNVALKLVRVEAGQRRGEKSRARLLREGQAMAKLAHPNVVPVFDAGTHGDDVFIAMEQVDGVTLREWLRRERRDWRLALRVCIDAARGLAAAHRAGIIHRDFKPTNVLVGDDGRARVLDFGLARAAAVPESSTDGPDGEPSGPRVPGLTEVGEVAGTPAYMAPERLMGEPGDELGDQFAFGVALYEALAGAHPFPVDGHGDMRFAMIDRQSRPPPPVAGVPLWLQRVVARALRADRSARWPSMDAMIAALLDDPWRRARRLAVAAVAALACVGVAYEAWAWTRPGLVRLVLRSQGAAVGAARVTVDGEAAELDAQGRLTLAPGLHHVRAEVDGHRPAEAIVDAIRGAEIELAVAVVREQGLLDIDVEPRGAAIVIDGVEHGSPLRDRAVPTGRHEVVVRRAGDYERRLTVDVVADRRTRAFVALPPGLVWSQPETGVNLDLSWIGDVDRDGRPELAHRNFNRISVFDPWHDAPVWSASFGARQDERSGWADVDGDGVLDGVVIHHADGQRVVSCWSGRSRGVDPPPLWRRGVPEPAGVATAPLLIDGDGDGDLDVVVAPWDDGAIAALDGRNGRTLWRLPTLTAPLAIAARVDGTTAAPILVALDRERVSVWELGGAAPRLGFAAAAPEPAGGAATSGPGATARRVAAELRVARAAPGAGGDGNVVVARIGDAAVGLGARGEVRWRLGDLEATGLVDADGDGRDALTTTDADGTFALRDPGSGATRWSDPGRASRQVLRWDDTTVIVRHRGEQTVVLGAADLAPFAELHGVVGAPRSAAVVDWGGGRVGELAIADDAGVATFDRTGAFVTRLWLERPADAIASAIDANGDGAADLLVEAKGPAVLAGPRVLWRRRGLDAIRSAPVVLDVDGDHQPELAMFASLDTTVTALYLLDARTGIVEVAATGGSHDVIRSPLVLAGAERTDVFHVGGGTLYHHDAGGGGVVASRRLDGAGYASPAAVDLDLDGRSEVAWIDWAGQLRVVDRDTLGDVMTVALGSGAWTSPQQQVGRDGRPRLVVSLLDGRLAALGVDGTELWRHELGARNAHSPIVADLDGDGRVELVTTAGVAVDRRDAPHDLVAFALDDGRPLWRWAAQGWPRSRPATVDLEGDGALEIVYGTGTGEVACRGTDGVERWRMVAPTAVDVSTALVVADLDHDGRAEIVVGYDDGHVRVLDAVEGRPLWSFAAGDEIEAPPVVVDVDGDGVDEVVVGSHDRNLYCLRHLRR